MYNTSKSRNAWPLVSERLLQYYRNQSKYSYQDPNRNVSFCQEPIEAKPSSHSYQDRLKTLWLYIEKIYFKDIGQTQMMILKQLKEDRIIWNTDLKVQDQKSQDLLQYQKEMKQVFSEAYLKQKECLKIDEQTHLKEKELSYNYWMFLRDIDEYKEEDILQLKMLKKRGQSCLFNDYRNEEESIDSLKMYEYYLKQQLVFLKKHVGNKNKDVDSTQLNETQLQKYFSLYENVKQNNSSLIQSIQEKIQLQITAKLRDIYTYCQGDLKYFPKGTVAGLHLIHLHSALQNRNIVEYLKGEIERLQKRQISDSIERIIQQQTPPTNKDTTQIYYVSFQPAMNLNNIFITLDQLVQMNRYRECSVFDKRVEVEGCQMCHHCKTMINKDNLSKCTYKSSKFGIPTPFPSFHDPYLYNLLKYQDRKYDSIYQINSNPNVQSKYIYYTFQNNEYHCNRYYCELCIRAYRPYMKDGGLCPFCQRICCCSRCTRDVCISKLKSMYLYMGEDVYKMQENSYFLNFYRRNENLCKKQDKKIGSNDRTSIINYRIQLQEIRILGNMTWRRQKLKKEELSKRKEMLYAKLRYIMPKKGYSITHLK